MPGIDFKQVRQQISIAQVLDLLGFVPTVRIGMRLRGPCPIHGSCSSQSRVFSVSLAHDRYRCFRCHSAGTQLDLWAAVHDLPLHAATKDVCRRLGVPIPWLAFPPAKPAAS